MLENWQHTLFQIIFSLVCLFSNIWFFLEINKNQLKNLKLFTFWITALNGFRLLHEGPLVGAFLRVCSPCLLLSSLHSPALAFYKGENHCGLLHLWSFCPTFLFFFQWVILPLSTLLPLSTCFLLIKTLSIFILTLLFFCFIEFTMK